MPIIIAAAAAAPHRKNADEGSMLGYILGSAVFLAAVYGLFTLAGFTV